MEIFYGDNKIKKKLSSLIEINKAFGNNAKMVARRMTEIKNAPTLATILALPGPNCHPLSGDLKGEWAVNVSGNYRMIFELNHVPIPKKDDGSIDARQVLSIIILRVQDYH